jgi:hypothetical protein
MNAIEMLMKTTQIHKDKELKLRGDELPFKDGVAAVVPVVAPLFVLLDALIAGMVVVSVVVIADKVVPGTVEA